MHTIKNISSIPLDIPTMNGPAILGIGESGSFELSALDAEIFRHSPMVDIVDGAAKADDEDDEDSLREEAEELGIDVDKRWGAKRLRAEIDKKLAE